MMASAANFCRANAARWRELGNSTETRIFIIPTPINNSNTNVVIGLSFRLSSPTIPEGRQAAPWAKQIARTSHSAAAAASASAASLSRSRQMRRRVARERPPQWKAVQKAPEGAPYLQPLLRCDGAGRILLRSSTKTECSTLARARKLCHVRTRPSSPTTPTVATVTTAFASRSLARRTSAEGP